MQNTEQMIAYDDRPAAMAYADPFDTGIWNAGPQAAAPACTQTKRIGIVSSRPDRIHELVREISAGCFDVLVFRRLASMLDSGAEIDLYLFDFTAADVYGDFSNIRAFAASSDIGARSIFLVGREEREMAGNRLSPAGETLLWPYESETVMDALARLLTKPGLAGSKKDDAFLSGIMRYKDLQVDARKMTVGKAGKRVELTKTEYELLVLLLQAEGAVLTREMMMERMRSAELTGASNVIDVHVRSLRKKLGDRAVSSKYIVTVRGAGYRLAEVR